jgi:hypothetical protein
MLLEVAFRGAFGNTLLLFTGLFFLFCLQGRAYVRDLLMSRSFGFFERLNLLCLAAVGILPVRWFLGYMGSEVAAGIWTIAIILGAIIALRCAQSRGDLRSVFINFVCIFLFFFITSLCLQNAWYVPNDINNQNLKVLLPDQGDLWPHYALQQIIAFNHDFGLYPSPVGFPDKLTIGSYGASLFAATNLVASSGPDDWSISFSRLAILFFFQLFLIGLLSLGESLSKISRWTSFAAASVAVVMIYKIFGSAVVDSFFIHSINNGAGVACATAVIGVLCLQKFDYQSKTKIMLLLSVLPSLLMIRANWAPFWFCFVGIMVAIECFKFGILKIANPPIIIVGALALVFSWMFFAHPLPFAYPSIKMKFGNGFSDYYLHYHEWYPSYLAYLQRCAGVSVWLLPINEVVVSGLIALPWFVNRRFSLAAGLFVSFFVLGFLKFFMVPISDPGAYGSTEPLGNAFLLNQVVFVVGYSLILGRLLFGWIVNGRLLCGVTGPVLLAGLLNLASREQAMVSLSESQVRMLQDARGRCSSEIGHGIYSGDSIIDALSGCASATESRYSKKLSAGSAREELRVIAAKECSNNDGLKNPIRIAQQSLIVYCYDGIL